jgi:transposase
MRPSTRPSKSSGARSKAARVRPRRDREAMEERRKRAASLFRQGLSQAEVARALEVTRQSVSRWHRAWREGGVAALKKAERAGRPPLLNAAELKRVERRLLKGAEANGFPTELWTLERVTVVIATETGVEYHPGHVWRLLRQMGWSLQKPARRALERDEEAIQRWVAETWPEVKKTPPASRPGSSSRTSRASRSSPSSDEPGLPEAERRS